MLYSLKGFLLVQSLVGRRCSAPSKQSQRELQKSEELRRTAGGNLLTISENSSGGRVASMRIPVKESLEGATWREGEKGGGRAAQPLLPLVVLETPASLDLSSEPPVRAQLYDTEVLCLLQKPEAPALHEKRMVSRPFLLQGTESACPSNTASKPPKEKVKWEKGSGTRVYAWRSAGREGRSAFVPDDPTTTRRRTVRSNDHGVVCESTVSVDPEEKAEESKRTSLVRLQRQLLVGLEVLLLHPLDLGGKDDLGGRGRIDTVGLDRDDGVSSVFEEVVGVEGNDTRLIGLGDIGKDDIDHRHEHAVLVGVTGVLDDGCGEGASERGGRRCERGESVRMTLVRFLAMLIRSRPDRWENSTA